MAYKKIDYVYIIVVTLLFTFQLYCLLIRNRDVLLTILFPIAIIFTFIIGMKRFFNKSALKELDDPEGNQEETTEGEITFRILFLLLNVITFILYIVYCFKIPSVSFREIKLTDQLIYRETNKAGEFKPIPVCSPPELSNIDAPRQVDLLETGSMNPIKQYNAKSPNP